MHTITRPLSIALKAIFAFAALILIALPFASSTVSLASGAGYYVAPNGSDGNDGRSAGSPFATIQKGLDVAQAGDTINLAAGSYLQDAVSQRNGSRGAPITITGPSDAVVNGGGGGRVIEINHDYITLSGFTIDGFNGGSYREKLLYVIGNEPRNGVTGLKVLGMTLKNAGGECVRLRYFVQQSEIANSTIGPCGRDDFPNGVWAGGGKNGEGIYIGTAPEQRGDGKNPTIDPDLSIDNIVHHNSFDTQGNECVDIKEAATANIVEYNSCTGQKDPESAGLDSRGSGNIFRYNQSFGNLGAGVRLGGDTASDGQDNVVIFNTLRDNQAGGIKFQRAPQQQACGNTMLNNTGGNSAGSYASQFNPTAACSGDAATQQPTATVQQPTATAQQPTATAQQPTATAISTSDSTTLAAVADTYIKQTSPTKLYGRSSTFKADTSPETWALIRFQVPAGAPVRRLLLRLYVANSSDQGGRVVAITGDWNEKTTWNTRPSTGQSLGELGKAVSGKYIIVDVTSALKPNGTVSLAIQPISSDSVSYGSREGKSQRAPQLIVER